MARAAKKQKTEHIKEEAAEDSDDLKPAAVSPQTMENAEDEREQIADQQAVLAVLASMKSDVADADHAEHSLRYLAHLVERDKVNLNHIGLLIS